MFGRGEKTQKQSQVWDFSQIKHNLKEFVASRPVLQEMLKEVLQREGKRYK